MPRDVEMSEEDTGIVYPSKSRLLIENAVGGPIVVAHALNGGVRMFWTLVVREAPWGDWCLLDLRWFDRSDELIERIGKEGLSAVIPLAQRIDIAEIALDREEEIETFFGLRVEAEAS